MRNQDVEAYEDQDDDVNINNDKNADIHAEIWGQRRKSNKVGGAEGFDQR